jgi:hypothetical protein
MSSGIRVGGIDVWRGRHRPNFTIAETNEIRAAGRAAIPVCPEQDHQFLPEASAMAMIVRPVSQFQAEAVGAFGVFQLGDKPHIDKEPVVALAATKRVLTTQHLGQVEKGTAMGTPQALASASRTAKRGVLHTATLSFSGICACK